MNKIICLVGMAGSGKSVVADELVRNGFEFARFGQITLDIVKERGLEPSEENERPIREEMRKEHGMGAYAKLNIPKFDKLLEKANLVADGLYSWTEYKILKNYYQDRLTVVAILAPPETRYARLAARTEVDEKMRNRPATREQAIARDYAEIENIEKGGPIAMADYYILNITTEEDVIKEARKLLE
jgi:dephospho-CoA kinase